MSGFDPIRSAGAFSDAQAVLDLVVRSLSEVSPSSYVFGCIYRSHPALEIGLSAACQAGHLISLPGLHEAFAQSATFFDRWSVQSRQRERWREYPGVDPSPLHAYWTGDDFWKQKAPGPFRRIVVCQGDRPLAYVSYALRPGQTWSAEERRRMSARYHRVADAIRLAALSWRARHSPLDQSTALQKGDAATVVLSGDGTVLASSPDARRWMGRDGELTEAITALGRVDSSRPVRLRQFALRTSQAHSVEGIGWRVIRVSARSEVAPAALDAESMPDLSPRELELCEWLVQGRTNSEIAGRMGIRPSTVKTMLERLYFRREVGGRVALVQQLMSADRRIVSAGGAL
jgi:DNA-binding CsgD family transcriptional regulator